MSNLRSIFFLKMLNNGCLFASTRLPNMGRQRASSF